MFLAVLDKHKNEFMILRKGGERYAEKRWNRTDG